MGEGVKRELDPKMQKILMRIQAAVAIYIMIAILAYPDQIVHRGVCFSLFTSLALIRYASPGSASTVSIPWQDWIMVILSVSVGVYIFADADRIISRFPFADPVTGADIFFGTLTIFLLLESIRRIIGPWLSILSILAVGYLYAGPWIPGLLAHSGYSADDIIDELFLTTDGVFGSTMGVAVNQILVFIFFGAFLVKSGIGAYMYDLAVFIAGRSRGGIAKAAILTSAFFGMISGSAVANVSSMGVITIPMMKKNGYQPEFAAALESCASVGGIFMPPIMGSVAFVMAEVAGFPYRMVALAALLPAVLYYLAIFFAIDARASKLKLKGVAPDPKITFAIMARRGAVYLLPVIFLVARIISGTSPSRVGIESIAAVIIASLVFSDNRINPQKMMQALAEGVGQGIMIVTTMAACGIMIGVINLTGVSAKFSSLLLSAAGDSLPATLFLAMLLAMFLGLAMNITPAYLLTAVVAAPAMIGLGVPVMAAHMFILFYAAMATVTPPVALTAFAAASIADAPPMRVGFQAMRIGFVAYVLPFAFVAHPGLLLGSGVQGVLLAILSGVFAVFCFAFGMEGWFRNVSLGLPCRLALIMSGVAGLFTNLPILLILISVAAAALFAQFFFASKNEITEGAGQK